MENQIPQYSVIVIGDKNTGKTSIITRYIQGSFMSTYFATPLPATSRKEFTSPKGDFQLTIWDTAGSEEWTSLNSGIYSNVDAVVFVVSVDDGDSINSVTSHWKPEIDNKNTNHDYKKFIAINKIDLNETDTILTDEAVKENADEIGAPIFRVSAKESIGIEELFNNVAAQTHGIAIDMVNKPPATEEPMDPGCQCYLI